MGTGCTTNYEETHRGVNPKLVQYTSSVQKNAKQPTHQVHSKMTQQSSSAYNKPMPANNLSVNQLHNGVQQATRPSGVPVMVGNEPLQYSSSQANLQRPIEQVDVIKAKLKNTRDRVNNLMAQQEGDIAAIDQQIMVEKNNGLKNKPKVKYLLKQRKEYLVSLENLRTRQQVVMKTVSDLNQQHLDKNIVDVLDQSNKYMQEVQEQLERKNWREVLFEARTREDVFQNVSIPEDPDVDRMYADLERQVQNEKIGNRTQMNQQNVASQMQGQIPQNQYPPQQQPYINYQPQQAQTRVNQINKPTVPGVPFALSIEGMGQAQFNGSQNQTQQSYNNYTQLQQTPQLNAVVPPLIQPPSTFQGQQHPYQKQLSFN